MRRVTATAITLLLLTATACSGDDGGSAAPSTTTAPGESTTTTAAPDCPTPAEEETGTLERTLTVDGAEHPYLVAVPTGYDGTAAVPVVFTFHGLGSNARGQLLYSGWGSLGEEEGFLTVAPNAQAVSGHWDALSPASKAGSDAAFLAALVQEVERTFCVDPARVYATGMSSGSALSFGLACRNEIPFAAYGAVAAAIYNEALCGGAPPTSIVYFHGTDDRVVPYAGGPVSVLPGATIKPAAETLAAWAEHDGCGEPDGSTPADDVDLTRWTDCDDGSAVDFYTVTGGGHTWPGAIPVARLGATTGSIDATELMWAFFEAHPLGD